MPIYTIVMAEKLNLPIYLAHADNHFYNVWDDGKNVFNIEATTGKSYATEDMPTEKYMEYLQGQELAIERGVYLRPMKSKDEIIGYLYSCRSQCVELILKDQIADRNLHEICKDWATALYLNPRDFYAASCLAFDAARNGNREIVSLFKDHLKNHLGMRGKKAEIFESYVDSILNKGGQEFDTQYMERMRQIHAEQREINNINRKPAPSAFARKQVESQIYKPVKP